METCFREQNIVKAGGNLVSDEKRVTWQAMTREDKVRSASALLNAMETATMTMVTSIAEPTVISSKDDNIGKNIIILTTLKYFFLCLTMH